MKKVVFCVLLIALLVSLGACGNSTTEESAPVEGESPATPSVNVAESEEPTISSLVVYFSWSGHTENVANVIAEQTGADIFEIIPQTPYSDDYNTPVSYTHLDVYKRQERMLYQLPPGGNCYPHGY